MQVRPPENQSDKITPTKRGLLRKVGGPLNIALTGIAGVSGYNTAREEGQGVAGSLAKGLADGFLVDLIGWKAYIGGAALMTAPKVIGSAVSYGAQRGREYSMAGTQAPFGNGTFVDSEQAYTMRQAGMNLIQNSVMNTKRTTLGNEAQFMHR